MGVGRQNGGGFKRYSANSEEQLKDEGWDAEYGKPVLKLKYHINNFHFIILASRGMEESRGTVYRISL
jgi:hypothetical protein